MASNLSVPVTPVRQRALTPSSDRSPTLNELDCTPETLDKLKSLKRKASNINDQPTPYNAAPFLRWRLDCLDGQLDVLTTELEAFEEAQDFFTTSGKSQDEYLADVRKEIDTLTKEKIVIIEQQRFFAEDISDTTVSAEEAYITELEIAFHEASQNKAHKLLKQPRLKRADFKAKVLDYLKARRDYPGSAQFFCNAIGKWIFASENVKCAHIVPFSFDVKE